MGSVAWGFTTVALFNLVPLVFSRVELRHSTHSPLLAISRQDEVMATFWVLNSFCTFMFELECGRDQRWGC